MGVVFLIVIIVIAVWVLASCVRIVPQAYAAVSYTHLYDLLTPDDMVVVDLNGNKVEGKYNPSSDTATHVEPVSYTHLDVYKRQIYEGCYRLVVSYGEWNKQ